MVVVVLFVQGPQEVDDVDDDDDEGASPKLKINNETFLLGSCPQGSKKDCSSAALLLLIGLVEEGRAIFQESMVCNASCDSGSLTSVG